jgi:methylenetetrahydrofolate--tRNA-(uracil-5-)-methyltransferase
VAGLNAARLANGQAAVAFPSETAIGALCHYICQADPEAFQPMNIAFGLFPPLPERIRNKRDKKRALGERALSVLDRFLSELD